MISRGGGGRCKGGERRLMRGVGDGVELTRVRCVDHNKRFA